MDQKLKQRLVGAVVLISLAVIFIPIILEGPDDEWSPDRQGMPEPPKIDYRAGIELPPPDAGLSPRPVPGIVEPVAEEATAPDSVTAEPVPEPKRVPEPVAVVPEPATPPPVPATKTHVPADAWVIQVGSFSLQPNAAGLRDRLRRDGFAAFLQDVKTADGKTSYRVLVGPMDDRAQAEKLHQRLVREQQLKGIVVQGGG